MKQIREHRNRPTQMCTTELTVCSGETILTNVAQEIVLIL